MSPQVTSTKRQADTGSLWQLVLVTIAIRTRNTVQVAAVTAFNFAFLGYAVIQVSSQHYTCIYNKADR